MHHELPHNDHKNNGNADYGTDEPRPIYYILLPHELSIALAPTISQAEPSIRRRNPAHSEISLTWAPILMSRHSLKWITRDQRRSVYRSIGQGGSWRAT